MNQNPRLGTGLLKAALGSGKVGLSELAPKFRVRRKKRPDDLRGTLMAGFAVLAIGPMIVAVVFMTRVAENGIVNSTGDLAAIGRETLLETSSAIGEKATSQIGSTGRQLTDIGSKAVRDTADALLSASEQRFVEANKALIDQGEQANRAVAEQLMRQSQGATRELSNNLIRVSVDSNRELSRQSAGLAEKTIVKLADGLVAQAFRNTNAISQHVVAQNTEAAKRLSERMLSDIEREPVVNFKTLASIFAQGIATSKVTPIQDGYLAVVDGRGRVLASTRYKKGTALHNLPIVEQALGGQTSEDALVRFNDGSDGYLGVFARRHEGGAVIFAYKADRARVDTERMQRDIQGTLDQMGSSSSKYVISSLEAQRPVMRTQATQLSKQAIALLETTNRTLSARTAARMQSQADASQIQTVSGMTARSQATAKQSTAAMKQRSEDIAAAAIAGMRPIGKSYAEKAEVAMRAKAERALLDTATIIPRAAGAASEQATRRMAPEARRLADKATRDMWVIAGVLLALEIALAILASLLISGRIANPILRQQEKAREERERLNREMEIASKIQTCLLPPVPVLGDFDVALSMVPAEEVGGDFVDLMPARETGAFWIGIGDVTGHGLTPGLIMMMAQSTFNALGQAPGMTPKGLYDGMNRVLYQNIKDRLRTTDHMTMSILKHERDGTFVHCGSHLDILVYRSATGLVERIATEGPWVGLLPDSQDFTYEVAFTLDPHDVLLLYTDGLIEVQNVSDEQWDMERLCDALARYACLDAKDIQAKLLGECLHWANQVLDDISMIVIKRMAIEAEASAVVPALDASRIALTTRLGTGRDSRGH